MGAVAEKDDVERVAVVRGVLAEAFGTEEEKVIVLVGLDEDEEATGEARFEGVSRWN